MVKPLPAALKILSSWGKKAEEFISKLLSNVGVIWDGSLKIYYFLALVFKLLFWIGFSFPPFFPGSTSTRNSSQKGSSVLSIKQKSRKELLMEKFREQMIKAKAFTIKKWAIWGVVWVWGEVPNSKAVGQHFKGSRLLLLLIQVFIVCRCPTSWTSDKSAVVQIASAW